MSKFCFFVLKWLIVESGILFVIICMNRGKYKKCIGVLFKFNGF